MSDSAHIITLRRGTDSLSGTVVESTLPGVEHGTEVVIEYLGAARDEYRITVGGPHGETYPALYDGEADNVITYRVTRGE
ncbi:hypothetical protein [Deinococcus pimensis]|uniref:hypothetical protein n=1 Tax=Deinococcus pimensis TaxID=309888 RepID=UPI000482E446|nr:hypothetical protein [Deinococcus pimensis]